jgi:carboxylesterase
MRLIIPESEPFLLRGGPTACLLLHGFSATPQEMRPLGDYLGERSFTALGVRLAGHATDPHDLSRTRWTDWLLDVENGLALLEGIAERVVLVGQSMGGMIALAAAARYPVAGVVAMSTPFGTPPDETASRLRRPKAPKCRPRPWPAAPKPAEPFRRGIQRPRKGQDHASEGSGQLCRANPRQALPSAQSPPPAWLRMRLAGACGRPRTN